MVNPAVLNQFPHKPPGKCTIASRFHLNEQVRLPCNRAVSWVDYNKGSAFLPCPVNLLGHVGMGVGRIGSPYDDAA